MPGITLARDGERGWEELLICGFGVQVPGGARATTWQLGAKSFFYLSWWDHGGFNVGPAPGRPSLRFSLRAC
jgi:hypothetical protein